jgi:Flp pilus assembly protein TadD
MRFGSRLHVALAVAASIVLAAASMSPVALGQPTARPTPGPTAIPAREPTPDAVPRPAGSSSIESADVPAWRPPPPRFAVVPFENRSGVRVFDWLVAGAPFEISEKTEAVLGLEPTGGALHVGSVAVPSEPAPIAVFAAAHDAAFVITGWVERPNWQLRIELALWKISGGTAVVAARAQRTGDVKAYHQLLGEALGEVWATGGGMTIDPARAQRLQRALASDPYAVTLMGRGLGHLIAGLAAARAAVPTPPGAVPTPPGATPSVAPGVALELKAAEHDLERAVFIDPKCFEAQRLLGELYLAQAPGDAKLAARAAAKFNYANDLAPDDIASLRAAAATAARSNKHELALELSTKLVTLRPWDLDARYELGAALWRTGDPAGAEKQLDQVVAKRPDQLAARRVLVLIHASRADTAKLVSELESIAQRAPGDLETKADLASAYGAIGRWSQAITALEAIAAARPTDVALHVRIGDAHRHQRDLDRALVWYARAARLAPESSWAGFAAAQALFDAGKLAEAQRAYTALQRYRDDLPAAEQALGVIALLQHRPDDAAWYLRRAVREAPRSLLAWRALGAAELARRDAGTALRDVRAALPSWPRDRALHYLAGVAYAMLDERAAARRELVAAVATESPGPSVVPNAAPSAAPGMTDADVAAVRVANVALGALDAGAVVVSQLVPEIVRPWGDAEAVTAALDRYAAVSQVMAATRASYQRDLLALLGVLNRGPEAPAKPEPVRRCPLTRVATRWAAAQRALAQIARLGVDLEATWRFIARHDEAGATASLLPNARTQVAAARRSWRVALADLAGLRAEWTRALGPELRAVGCTDRLLAAAVVDPVRYQRVEEDRPPPIPTTQPPRPRARATFYVDNTRCLDAVEVWIDGTQLGQVAPGRRSALVADGGDRTLCLLVPGAAQCGDRGTVRQVYLHDGWSVTMHCSG